MKTNPSHTRLALIDLWRGVLLVLISLLTLWYFTGNNMGAEFWTRRQFADLPPFQFWATLLASLAIPSIYILLGASIILFSKNKKWESWNTPKIARTMATRGVFLIALQFLIENPLRLLANFKFQGFSIQQINTGFEFYSSNLLYFGILSSLGFCLIFWSVFTKIRSKQLLAISVLLMGLGWAIINLKGLSNPNEAIYFRFLAIPGFTIPIKVGFALLPWMGLPGFGMVLARYYRKQPIQTLKITTILALVMLLVFVVLRWKNLYDDFTMRDNGLIGFFNFSKLPPSLSYIVLSASFGLTILYLSFHFIKKRTLVRDALIVYGSSPLLFYILQLFLFGIAGLFIDFSASPVLTILTWISMLTIILPLLDYFEYNFKALKTESVWNYF